jgi:hypothetical protein
MSYPICIQNVYLNFCQGTSNKDYNIFIDEVADGIYDVYSNYGKHRSNLKHFPIETNVSYGRATLVFAKVKREKENKGYNLISENVNLWESKKKSLQLKASNLLTKNKISEAEYDKMISMLNAFDDDTRVLVEKLISTHFLNAA